MFIFIVISIIGYIPWLKSIVKHGQNLVLEDVNIYLFLVCVCVCVCVCLPIPKKLVSMFTNNLHKRESIDKEKDTIVCHLIGHNPLKRIVNIFV